MAAPRVTLTAVDGIRPFHLSVPSLVVVPWWGERAAPRELTISLRDARDELLGLRGLRYVIP